MWIMEKNIETTKGLYRDYRDYVGAILGQWKRNWKLPATPETPLLNTTEFCS